MLQKEYYAHKEGDKKELIREHAERTAKLAESFAFDLLKPAAYESGRLHDIGKYQMRFQKRLDNRTIECPHAASGAIEVLKSCKTTSDVKESKAYVKELINYAMAYVIMGHHTGLPDGSYHKSKDENKDEIKGCSEKTTLQYRLKHTSNFVGENDYSAYKQELPVQELQCDTIYSELQRVIEEVPPELRYVEFFETYAFFVRYLYSCLVDADTLATKQAFGREYYNNIRADFDNMLKVLDVYMSEKPQETEVQKARKSLQEQAYKNSMNNSSNVSFLHMPTGSGKTLCSLKIALEKIKASNGEKKRIIYVIPYTSVINQTAKEFEDIFGNLVDIVQHHSNYQYQSDINLLLFVKPFLKKLKRNFVQQKGITTKPIKRKFFRLAPNI